MAGGVKWFDAPTNGEAPSLPVDQLGSKQARALRNFLVHHPGRIVPRGRLGGPNAADGGSLTPAVAGAPMRGINFYDDRVFAAYGSITASPTVDFWRVPINHPQAAGDLAQPELQVRGANMLTGATGGALDFLAVTTDGVLSDRFCRNDGYVYTVGAGGTSTAISTGVAQLNHIVKGDTVASGVILTNGPGFVQDTVAHAGRVWVAGARRPGGSDYDTSQIFYTIPNGTTVLTDVVTDWQDPVTGELNRFQIGAGDDGDFVVGFGRAGGHLIVFKRNSIWILYGTAPSNFTLRQLRTQSGCVDQRSIAICDEGVYFASQKGYESFDGTTFTLLSEAVSDLWIPQANSTVNTGTVNHGFIRSSPLPNGYIHVAMGTDPHAASQPDGAALAWLLHQPSGAWVRLSSLATGLGLGSGGYHSRMVATSNTVSAWGQSKWARGDSVTFGAAEATGVMDQDSGAAYNMDLVWTTYVDNMGSYRGTNGVWSTNNLRHATVDYKHAYTNTTPPQLDTFATLSAVDGFGTALVSAQNVQGYRPPAPLRARQMFDMKHESNRGDVSFTLQSTLGSSSSKRTALLDVYGMGVAFEHGRERHVA